MLIVAVVLETAETDKMEPVAEGVVVCTAPIPMLGLVDREQ
jgi:hypothetical protein